MDPAEQQPADDRSEEESDAGASSAQDSDADGGEDVRALRRGRLLGQFRVHYQPIIEMRDGTLAGMEALLRWQHPERGTLSAGSFVPTAERAGVIGTLDEEVLRTASVFRRDLRLRGDRQLPVTVNATAADLVRPGVVAGMRKTIEETRLPTERLEVEVANVLAVDRGKLHRALEELNAAGVRLALDDFAALPNGDQVLAELPFHGVKVDLYEVGESPDDGRELADRLAAARRRGLRVAAKRVETANHLRLLRALEIEAAQSYALGRPVRAAEFTALLIDAGLIASGPAPDVSAPDGMAVA